MNNKTVSRQEWLVVRAKLLKKEKAFTYARAELAAERQAMPWVRVEKVHRFTGSEGEITLSDLFLDRSQLVIYHLMFGAGWQAPCVGCTQWANALNGTTSAFEKVIIYQSPNFMLIDRIQQNIVESPKRRLKQ